MRKHARILLILVVLLVLSEMFTGILSTIVFGQLQLVQPLMHAGMNRYELSAAIHNVSKEHRKAMIFLIANMPKNDLKTLKKEFLVENVELAYKTREEVPWGKDIPDEIFLNYVVPYTVSTEKCENWRPALYKLFIDKAKKCNNVEEAVLKLDMEVRNTLDVHYKPGPRKMDQSPFESMDRHPASCAGLTILFVSVCRAVGIPARAASTRWVTVKSWHNWTEVWDHQWRFISQGDDTVIDTPWVAKYAMYAIPHNREHGIYTASFQKTNTKLPVLWNPKINSISAVETTCFYTNRRTIKIDLAKRQADKQKKLRITISLDGNIVAMRNIVKSAEFILAAGKDYEITVSSLDGQKLIEKHLRLPKKSNPYIQLQLY